MSNKIVVRLESSLFVLETSCSQLLTYVHLQTTLDFFDNSRIAIISLLVVFVYHSLAYLLGIRHGWDPTSLR